MNARAREIVRAIGERLLEAAGPQGWWPGDGRDEIVVGAVLTQNAAWSNVEKAIANLRTAGLLSLARLAVEPPESVAPHIRPAGYFNVKAARLREVAEFFAPAGVERFDELARLDTGALRDALLRVRGVGPETADSILLYALGRASFVVDAYTIRILSRHGLCDPKVGYEELRAELSRAVPESVEEWNEYHALIVHAGKRHCRPRPKCDGCPLAESRLFATKAAYRALAGARGPG